MIPYAKYIETRFNRINVRNNFWKCSAVIPCEIFSRIGKTSLKISSILERNFKFRNQFESAIFQTFLMASAILDEKKKKKDWIRSCSNIYDLEFQWKNAV